MSQETRIFYFGVRTLAVATTHSESTITDYDGSSLTDFGQLADPHGSGWTPVTISLESDYTAAGGAPWSATVG